MNFENKEEMLRHLYQNNSKHSNYQILPTALRKVLNEDSLTISSRYEKERLDYILKYVSLEGKSVLDIGGNTGYFSFEALSNGSTSVTYCEGNKEHAEFVSLSAAVLGIADKIVVKNEYFNFDVSIEERYDVTLLLNVLHHVGDDYGNRDISITKAKESIKTSLSMLASQTKYLVFQLGFNWKGNRELCLFEEGTKQEMIEYMRNITSEQWEIVSIGIAEKRDGVVKYEPLSEQNMERDDSMGEFLNRPIFIMKSRMCK